MLEVRIQFISFYFFFFFFIYQLFTIFNVLNVMNEMPNFLPDHCKRFLPFFSIYFRTDVIRQ